MKRTILVTGIAYFFIFLFLYTGLEKLMDIAGFRQQLLGSPLLAHFAWFFAWALPITEIVLAIGLVLPATQHKALWGSLALMGVFTIYLVALLSIDDNLICSCGGIIEDLGPRQHIFFNLAAILLAAVGIVVDRRTAASPPFRRVATSLSCLLLVSIGWILTTAAMAPTKQRTGYEGQLVPVFSILLPDSVTRLSTADIPAGKPFIMIEFSPWCDHCHAEIKDIMRHIDRFGDTTIYLVTSYPFADMKKFYDFFEIKKYRDIVMGVDSKNDFMHFFKTRTIPYATIYDAKKRLKAVIPTQATAQLIGQTLDE